eukprot:2758195-Amphidinium_carterae.1
MHGCLPRENLEPKFELHAGNGRTVHMLTKSYFEVCECAIVQECEKRKGGTLSKYQFPEPFV